MITPSPSMAYYTKWITQRGQMPFSQLRTPKQEQNHRYKAENSFHDKNIYFTLSNTITNQFFFLSNVRSLAETIKFLKILSRIN
jgi:hypothetical protein